QVFPYLLVRSLKPKSQTASFLIAGFIFVSVLFCFQGIFFDHMHLVLKSKGFSKRFSKLT
ncbi:MAG: hypothetical protein COB67_12080, partial [SAR324 cluster bacterium]